jgi:hypothetical protein
MPRLFFIDRLLQLAQAVAGAARTEDGGGLDVTIDPGSACRGGVAAGR